MIYRARITYPDGRIREVARASGSVPNALRRGYPIEYFVADGTIPTTVFSPKPLDPHQKLLDENKKLSDLEAELKVPLEREPRHQFLYGAVDLNDRPSFETKMGASSDPNKRIAGEAMTFQKRNRADIKLMFKIPIGKMSLSERNDVEAHVRYLLGSVIPLDGPREWHCLAWEHVQATLETFRMCGPIHQWNYELLTWHP